MLKEATTFVAQQFYDVKQQWIASGKNIPDGTLSEMVKTACKKYDLPSNSINKETIYSCIRQNNISGQAH
jgi:hypothetical protein